MSCAYYTFVDTHIQYYEMSYGLNVEMHKQVSEEYIILYEQLCACLFTFLLFPIDGDSKASECDLCSGDTISVPGAPAAGGCSGGES